MNQTYLFKRIRLYNYYIRLLYYMFDCPIKSPLRFNVIYIYICVYIYIFTYLTSTLSIMPCVYIYIYIYLYCDIGTNYEGSFLALDYISNTLVLNYY